MVAKLTPMVVDRGTSTHHRKQVMIHTQTKRPRLHFRRLSRQIFPFHPSEHDMTRDREFTPKIV